MPEIDSLDAKIKGILPLAEVETVKVELRRLWQQTPLGYTALQLLQHGFDVWLARGAAPVSNVGGYLFLALSRRRPQDPTPALDRALAAGAASGKARAAEGATARQRAEVEDASAMAAEALFAEIEVVYPDFRAWGAFRQGMLLMSLGGDPREALKRQDPRLFARRVAT